jgi:hypothetical protein
MAHDKLIAGVALMFSTPIAASATESVAMPVTTSTDNAVSTDVPNTDVDRISDDTPASAELVGRATYRTSVAEPLSTAPAATATETVVVAAPESV